MSPSRESIVVEARRWIGTPYAHQASLIGVGCDCLGLLRGVWRARSGCEPEPISPYGPTWPLVAPDDPLLAAARRHMIAIATNSARPGDVLLFRWRARLPTSHVAILATSGTLVHAHEGARVAEIAFAPCWRRRVAAAFSFPGIID